ncbi:uncharacterized protein LOC131956252, partial [Physella acuta]|uniref:uncharacterized protein LOC131956252 n=1 Tax=Physella acuta TaxID=109671 RepID=UPI0027DBE6CD
LRNVYNGTNSADTITQWGDRTPWLLYQGFWSNTEPNRNSGDCVYISGTGDLFRWSLGTCEEQKSFVCQFPACFNGTFRCSNNKCVSSQSVCNGQDDCSDGSDEMNCPSRCNTVQQGASGVIDTQSSYEANTSCLWLVEGPIGTSIKITFTDFETEPNADVVTVLGKGKLEKNSVTLGHLSGTQNVTSFYSPNNLMIIRFTSDGQRQLRGFKANWEAVTEDKSSVKLLSEDFFQPLHSYQYPSPYLANQEIVYIISSKYNRQVILLKILDLDLMNGDYINVRDGEVASSPLLARLDSTTSPTKRYVFSTGPHMYLFYKTSQKSGITGRGFNFTYKTGCSVTLTEEDGEIISPGYPNVNYPNYQNCTWLINTSSHRPVTLQFDLAQFDIHSSDLLQVFSDVNTSSSQGKNVTQSQFSPNVTDSDGQLLVRFQTNAINAGVCPPLTNLSSDLKWTLKLKNGTMIGSMYNFTCQEGSHLVGSPLLVCLENGTWSSPVPKCSRQVCITPVILHAHVNKTTLLAGEAVEVRCDAGYLVNSSLSASINITCFSNSTFDRVPSCVLDSTYNPCAGVVCNSTEFCVMSNSTYECKCRAGYHRVGQSCQDINECVEHIDSCSHICVNTIGSYQCTCPEGFSLFLYNGSGGVYILQGENGLKPGDIYYINHTCVPNACPEPSISNGYITNPQRRYLVNDTVTIGCDLGYIPSGGMYKTVCSSFGNWSLNLNCTGEGANYTTVGYNTSVITQCNSTDKIRTCLFDPSIIAYRMQGVNSSCENSVGTITSTLTCGPPEMYLPTGAVALFWTAQSRLDRKSFRFECEFPYFQRGGPVGATVVCQDSGLWNLTNLDCVYGTCPDLRRPPDALVSYGNYSYMEERVFNCTGVGYTPKPEAGLICQQAEDGSGLEWNTTAPTCVDSEPPVFNNCPASPIVVSRYASASLYAPSAVDNSKLVMEITTLPKYFLPNQPIARDMNVTFVARDGENLTSSCQVVLLVKDETPPVVECPCPVLLSVSASTNVTYVFNRSLVTATDDTGVVNVQFSVPSVTVTVRDVGVPVDITATAFDAAGNNASCLFQVFTTSTNCFECLKNISQVVPYATPNCTGNFVSSTGMTPCFQCQGNTYKVNSTHCLECPLNTQVVKNEFNPNCKNSTCKCAPECDKGQYSVTGYKPICKACPAGYTSTKGSRLCTECLSNQTSVPGSGECIYNTSLCNPSPCANNGSCVVENHSFQCQCPYGTTGSRCETNVNDCTPDSCNGRGTCVDQLGLFKCSCVEGFNGSRCEIRVGKPCDKLVCDPVGTSRCENLNEIYARCVCRSGYTGANCSQVVDIGCASAPCHNGGSCTSSNGSYTCHCLTGFHGLVCQFEYTTGQSVVGQVVNNTNLTYRACQQMCFNAQLACDGFTFEPSAQGADSGICKIYSRIDSVVNQTNGIILGNSACSANSEDSFFSPWMTPRKIENGVNVTLHNITSQFEEVICHGTQPLDAKCRLKNNATVQLPAGVSCNFDGVKCTPSSLTNCSDIEMRFLCARSRVFANKKCVALDVCGTSRPCRNGTCKNDPTRDAGYLCECLPGYEGAQCQHDIDECQKGGAQTCLNGATCVDGFLNTTCICAPGFTGVRCELNIDDCLRASCNTTGGNCVDGVNQYTCVCKPGYTGLMCQTPVDDCLSQPCHNGNCTDATNGFVCECSPGWTGIQCDTLIDLCSPSQPCGTGAECFNLINDFYCNCPSQTYGKTCQNACSYPNSCFDACPSSSNNCSCLLGTNSSGCPLSNLCNNKTCYNGGTCRVNQTLAPVCDCVSEFTGENCENHVNNCVNKACPATSVCIDGSGTAFCRCPLGKTGTGCTEDASDDFDICLRPSLDITGASLHFPVLTSSSFTIKLWVKYTLPGSTGAFFTLLKARSQYVTDVTGVVFALDNAGLTLNGSSFLAYGNVLVNDGHWHHIVATWDKATSQVNLAVDFVKRNSSTVTSWSSLEWSLPVIGRDETSVRVQTEFVGCVSQLDMLNYNLNMDTDLKMLEGNLNKIPGNISRWGELSAYGNFDLNHPSLVNVTTCSSCSSVKDLLSVLFCPPNIQQNTTQDVVPVYWGVPTFLNYVNVTSSHTPGANFSLGQHTVSYVGRDKTGNAVVCTFSVYVNSEFCPKLPNPRGAGNQTCASANSFSYCTLTCPAQLPVQKPALIKETPGYFTCGPDGDWVTLTDGLYPACGRVEGESKVNVELMLTYTNSSLCRLAIQVQAVKKKIQNQIKLLQQTWGPVLCVTTDCSDVQVACTSSVNKSSVNVIIANLSANVQNGTKTISIGDIFQVAALDDNMFSLEDISSNNLNKDDFVVNIKPICPVGQVVRYGSCVSCGPGTYYNSTLETCENCPIGQYSESYGQILCTVCPPGSTTYKKGSDLSSLCISICPSGQQWNNSTKVCEGCQKGFYRNSSVQNVCEKCPTNSTTVSINSTSVIDCSVGICPSGQQWNNSINVCEGCQKGFYRNSSLQNVCEKCPTYSTTVSVNSTSVTDCSVGMCPSGQQWNNSINVCEGCQKGFYRNSSLQNVCEKCPTNSTTVSVNSTSVTDCSVGICPSGQQWNNSINVCEGCQKGFYRNSSLQNVCEKCPTNSTTVSVNSTSVTDCSVGICPSGQQWNNSINVCEGCQKGFYRNSSLQNVCEKCPTNSTTVSVNSTSVTDCSVGICPSGQQWNNSINVCEGCQKGFYRNSSLQNVCEKCPTNSTTVSVNSTSVTDCSVGICPSGQQWNNSTKVCEGCEKGFYRNSSLQNVCEKCPTNSTTVSVNSTSVTDCSVGICPSGQQWNNTTKVCEGCQKGFYRNSSLQNVCEKCPTNSTTVSINSTSVTDCSVGICPSGQQWNNTTKVCEGCQKGFYRNSSLQNVCEKCPDNLTTVSINSTSLNDCSLAICNAGNYWNSSQNSCLPCGIGFYQDVSGQSSCKTCPVGQTTLMAASTSCFVNCPAGLKWNETADLCVDCGKGFFRGPSSANTCVPCPAGYTTSSAQSNSSADCTVATAANEDMYKVIVGSVVGVIGSLLFFVALGLCIAAIIYRRKKQKSAPVEDYSSTIGSSIPSGFFPNLVTRANTRDIPRAHLSPDPAFYKSKPANEAGLEADVNYSYFSYQNGNLAQEA